MDKAYVVPLHELLAGVPRGTRLEINDPDGMGTRFIPVGRYCHEAAEALRARLAQPEPVIYARKEGDLIVVDLPQVPTGGGGISKREWVGLTDEEIAEIGKIWLAGNRMLPFPLARAIEAKLKEKNT